jgi:hypothetical protein
MTNRISIAELKAMQSKPKPSKYRNKKCEIDGIIFDSGRAGEHYKNS